MIEGRMIRFGRACDRGHSPCARSQLLLSIVGLIGLAGAQVSPAASGSGAAYGESAAPGKEVADREIAVPRSIVELQQLRKASSNNIESSSGSQGTVTLINLNPTINAWYLLKVVWKDGSEASYHLENPKPSAQGLNLDPGDPTGVELSEGETRHRCRLLAQGGADSPLAEASKSHAPYAPLCEGRLFL